MFRSIKRHRFLAAGLLAFAVALAIAGSVLAQGGTVPAGAVRLLGPIYPAYHAGSTNPLIDIGVDGMINLPDWILNNPMRDDTTVSHKIPAGAVDLSGLPSGGGNGLQSVASNETLTGTGVHDDPLGVANPFSSGDAAKLAGIEERATTDQTPAEIVAGLSGLVGTARLPASAVRDLPSGGSGIASVETDSTLTGTGAGGDPLRVAVPVTLSQKADLAALATLSTNANANRYVGFDSSGNLVARDGTTSTGALVATYGTLTSLQAATSTPGTVAIVYGDTLPHDGVYFRTNNAWQQISESLPSIIPASRLPQATSSSAGVISAAEYIKIAASIDAEHLHDVPLVLNANLSGSDGVLIDDASISTGSQVRRVTISELDLRWGGGGSAGPVSLDRLPDSTQIVSRAVQSGGNRPWPDSNVQFCGPIRASPYQSSDVAGIAAACGTDARRNDGVFIAPAYFIIRFSTAAYPNQPSLTDVPNLRAGYLDIGGGEDPVVPADLTALGEAGNYWYFATSVTTLPAGQPGVRVEIAEPTTLDLDLAANTVTPADLKFAPGDREDGRAITILNDDEFGSQFINDTRQLYNGPLAGISVTSAGRTSAAGRNNLTESLNLNSEPHGIIAGAWTPSLLSRSSNSITYHNNTDTITVNFTSTIEAIARETIYDGTTHFGYTLASTDIIFGTTHLGDAVLYAARHDDGSVSLVERYVAQTGHTQTTLSWSIPSRLEMVVLGSGAPRGLGGGSWFAYEAKPDADAFADGDLVLVYGSANKGAWRKTSTEVPGTADTGLSGLTIAPQTDLISNLSGSTEFVYFARAALNSDLPAGGAWTSAPAAMSSIRLGYDRNSLDNGFLVIVYSSPRTYAGGIVIRSGIYAIRLPRQVISGTPSTTTWRIDGLTAGEVRTLRQMSWAFSEPDAAGFSTVHTLTRVLGGDGNEYLMDYNPSTSVGLADNSFTLLNQQPAWSRALTVNDDERDLCVQVSISSQSANNDKLAWSTPMCVKAGDWRGAAVTNNGSGFTATGVSVIGSVVDASHTIGALTAKTIAVAKGPGDRLSVMGATDLTNLQRARVWLD